MVLNTINEADLKGKRVLIRVDFNVPLKDGKVTDNTRIKAALPTIKHILDNGASLVVMTHLGRPKGQKNPAFSLAPVAAEFSKLLGREVKLAPDVIGPEVEAVLREVHDRAAEARQVEEAEVSLSGLKVVDPYAVDVDRRVGAAESAHAHAAEAGYAAVVVDEESGDGEEGFGDVAAADGGGVGQGDHHASLGGYRDRVERIRGFRSSEGGRNKDCS